jgi:hypothetical protein
MGRDVAKEALGKKELSSSTDYGEVRGTADPSAALGMTKGRATLPRRAYDVYSKTEAVPFVQKAFLRGAR